LKEFDVTLTCFSKYITVNIQNLESDYNLNFALLPSAIVSEYNKVRYKFDIDRSGTYYIRNVFDNIKATISDDEDESRRALLEAFNRDIDDAWSDYALGFDYALDKVDLFSGISSEEDQIFKIFSLVYGNRFDILAKPNLLQFKRYPQSSKYGGIDFLSKHLYLYGTEVGKFTKAWRIILNNSRIFEPIFVKHIVGVNETVKKITVPVQVAILFAKMEIYRVQISPGVSEYHHQGNSFLSVNKLAKHLNISRQYINESFNDTNSNKNIFRNLKYMDAAIRHCKENGFEVDSVFMGKWLILKELKSN
jgi:hypothetical protein